MYNFNKLFLISKHSTNSNFDEYSNFIDYTKTKGEILDIVANNKFHNMPIKHFFNDFYITSIDIRNLLEHWNDSFSKHKGFFVNLHAYRVADYHKLRKSWKTASHTDVQFNMNKIIEGWTTLIKFQLSSFIKGDWNNIDKGIDIKYGLQVCNTDKGKTLKPHKTIPKITFTIRVIPNIEFIKHEFPVVSIVDIEKFLAETA